MSQIKFAHFNETSAIFNVISENNAILYRLTVRGSNTDSSVKAQVTFNEKVIGTVRPGLNLFIMDASGAIIDEKAFTFSRGARAAYTALSDVLKAMSLNHIAVLFTSDDILPGYEEYMHGTIGSKAWPRDRMLQHSSKISYAGIYSPRLRKIIIECAQATNGPNVDSSAVVDKVYDTFDDLAITGCPSNLVSDPEKYENTEKADFVKWPSDGSEQPLSSSNLRVGDKVMLAFELYTDATAWNAGAKSRLSHNYYQNGTLLSGYVQTSTKSGTWERFEGVFTIPAGATGFKTECIRHPITANTGRALIRNLVITPISGEPKIDVNHSFGVNGIRTTEIGETTDNNPVTNLLKLKHGTKKVTGNNFGEFPNSK